MRIATAAGYAGVIGDIVRDERTCDDCQESIEVQASAVKASVWVCDHMVDSVSAALGAAGVTYSVEHVSRLYVATRLHVMSINRYDNRTALAVR